jgi:SOS response regulatory protein OraA/RecX
MIQSLVNSLEYLDIVEKTSIELKVQLKERKVSKHTIEFIYGFFNEYMHNTGNGE